MSAASDCDCNCRKGGTKECLSVNLSTECDAPAACGLPYSTPCPLPPQWTDTRTYWCTPSGEWLDVSDRPVQALFHRRDRNNSGYPN